MNGCIGGRFLVALKRVYSSERCAGVFGFAHMKMSVWVVPGGRLPFSFSSECALDGLRLWTGRRVRMDRLVDIGDEHGIDEGWLMQSCFDVIDILLLIVLYQDGA